MWGITWKGMWSHKRRLLGTTMAVVLGVAFLTASLTIGSTMTAGFDNLFREANEFSDIDARLRAAANPLAAEFQQHSARRRFGLRSRTHDVITFSVGLRTPRSKSAIQRRPALWRFHRPTSGRIGRR